MIKTLVNSALALSLALSLSPSAEASSRSTNYEFNKRIGSAYIHNIKVFKKSNGGTAMSGYATLPTCDRNHYLSGYIKGSFYGNDGGYFKNYTLYRAVRSRNNEGQKVRLGTSTSSRMGTYGRVNIQVNLTCAPLTTQRQIENSINNTTNNVRDQLRHLDPSNLWR